MPQYTENDVSMVDISFEREMFLYWRKNPNCFYPHLPPTALEAHKKTGKAFGAGL